LAEKVQLVIEILAKQHRGSFLWDTPPEAIVGARVRREALENVFAVPSTF